MPRRHSSRTVSSRLMYRHLYVHRQSSSVSALVHLNMLLSLSRAALVGFIGDSSTVTQPHSFAGFLRFLIFAVCWPSIPRLCVGQLVSLFRVLAVLAHWHVTCMLSPRHASSPGPA